MSDRIVANIRLPIVGVMGSGNSPDSERSNELGRWLAGNGVHLLTGGGGGVMTAVSQAFFETRPRRGLVIGVLPGSGETGEPLPGYPNQWVEIPIVTHLSHSGKKGTDPRSRNHINILSSDVVVALPGSAGTSSEVGLAIAYGRPIVAYLDSRDQIPDLGDQVPVESNFDDVCAFIQSCLQSPTSR